MIPKPIRLPISTYRLQLNRSFNLADLDEIVDYLHSLGVTDCYLSPVMMSRPGSVHGYDVTDPTLINPELGDEKDFQRAAQHIQRLGMGIILDVVPNHMCISDTSNRWWFDVLENGPSSPHARFFDIDWHPPRENLAEKILLPVLGDQYGRILESQRIKIEYFAGSFLARVDDTLLPVAPRTWPKILQPVLEDLKCQKGESSREVLELESILTALSYLPKQTETNQERVRERQREKEVIKRRLAELEKSSSAVHLAIDEAVRAINGRLDDSSSFDTIEELLASQAYRLSFWRVAAEEINYRRFFEINHLAAIRIEDPDVFHEVHRKVLELVEKGWITGLRIDHADGLFDPVQYFADIQAACLHALQKSGNIQSSRASAPRESFYVIAEKILTGDERLRSDWQMYGTTGYGYLNFLNGVFVFRPSRRIFYRLFERLSGFSGTFSNIAYDGKKLILNTSMSSELNMLSLRLDGVCQQHRHSRDFTLQNLRFALGEVIACFPVYRTYIRQDQSEVNPEDRRHIITAIHRAKARNPAISENVFDLIGSVLLLQDPQGLTDAQKAERRLFVMRFQQLTGPIMAKGLEDTAFYRYFPLASLNEVGGSPELFGVSVNFLHSKNKARAESWPFSLLSTSTHDTKWSEDARVRLDVLSELPLQWVKTVHHWQALNKQHKVAVDGLLVPDRLEEYRLYQALIAAWPPGAVDREQQEELIERIQAYMQKAGREAKLYTSWIQPNCEYEDGLNSFVSRILNPIGKNPFLNEFKKFHRPISYAGMLNSLSQTMLKIFSVGVPDIYQGCEMWNFNLVDPDNRHPVDFKHRREELGGLDATDNLEKLADDLMRNIEDGRVKLYITSRALRFRRALPELFSRGSYVPLRAHGGYRHHVIAFARRWGAQAAVAVASRYFIKLGFSDKLYGDSSVWNETELLLPQGLAGNVYRDIFTNRIFKPKIKQGHSVLPLAEILSCFPVVLLEKLVEPA